MSDQIKEQETWVEHEEGEELAEEELMPIARRRPRRKLLTPLTALLFALLVGAGGFIAGVEVEKGEMSVAAFPSGRGALFGGPNRRFGTGSSGASTGRSTSTGRSSSSGLAGAGTGRSSSTGGSGTAPGSSEPPLFGK